MVVAAELVRSFYRADSSLNTQSLIFALWNHRDDAAIIEACATVLSQHITHREVYDDIEYFLPQIAHMLIHASSGSQSAFEHIVIILCQSSLHTALHISFILFAALEDYQAEDMHGKPNPSSDATLFSNCARILHNVERAVVQGDLVSLLIENSRDFAPNETSFRQQFAQDIVRSSQPPSTSSPSTELKRGVLLYKKNKRQSFQRKLWKERWFRIEDKVLYCYQDEGYTRLRRALPLQDCRLEVATNPHHENCFDIFSPITNTLFKLQAQSAKEMSDWMAVINSVIHSLPQTSQTSSLETVFKMSNRPLELDFERSESQDSMPRVMSGFPQGHSDDALLDGAVPISPMTAHALLKTTSVRYTKLAALQQKRYQFFLEQRSFIQKLTEICEELRFIDRSERQVLLKQRIAEVEIPKCCYLALVNSTDRWSKVISVLPKECHAFSTKARCPALLLFEMIDHPTGLDVATFLGGEELLQELGADSSEANGKSSQTFQGDVSPQLSKTFFKQSLRSNQSEGESDDEGAEAMGINYLNEAEGNESVAKHIEPFSTKVDRIKATSSHGQLPGWRLDGLIAKSNDDLRQEVFVMQMIAFLKRIFSESKVNVWVFTYKIVSTSKSTGLIQLIPNSISLDGLKKGEHWPGTLRAYFESTYGEPGSVSFQAALEAYIQSLAGYSVVAYVLAIKDRHNGNVMIDNLGHLIHIDFGFVFGLAPGKQFSMETAPWKLTEEMVEVMGGFDSVHFRKYAELTTQAFRAVRHHTEDITKLMEIMSHMSCYPAFRYNPRAIEDLRNRMMLDVTDENLDGAVMNLMSTSYRHTGTIRYDQFQVLTNGIAA